MAWALVIFFDERSERHMRSLWRALRFSDTDAVLYEGGSRPHLTLSVLETQDGTLPGIASAVAARTRAFDVCFESLGDFPDSGALYLSPRPSGELQALYADMYAALGDMRGSVWPLYRPGVWIPHSTVAMGLNETLLEKARRLAPGLFVPFCTRCCSLGVVKFRPVAVAGEYPLSEGGIACARPDTPEELT